MIILKTRSEVKGTVPQTAPDSMLILETRSEVKITVTGKLNGTIRHSKIHSHTKFWIPTSNNKRYAPDIIILKTRSNVKLKVIVTH